MKKLKGKYRAILFAIIAAFLYALNTPISKKLLEHVDETMMAAMLYLGAGIGIFLLGVVENFAKKSVKKEKLTKKELPYTIGMIILDIIAPILLMMGIKVSTSANVSLLNNFEIVATSMIALVIFKEVISKKLWYSIIMVTVASILLGFEGKGVFDFNIGSLFVIGACICWGFENNCTRMISNKNAMEIVVIKGICSGMGSMIIALTIGEKFPEISYILAVLVLGFFAYGLSIYFYILAQKDLGAAKTSAYYSVAPFLGVILCMVINGERPAVQFYIAFLIMVFATVLMIKDSIELQHTHNHVHHHSHEHSHGDLVHTHEHSHSHSHLHIHGEDEKGHSEHSHEEHDLEGHNHTHIS